MGPFARSARELMETAAGAGMRRAWELMRLTPREIEMEMQAHAARIRQEREAADLLAWLAGRYALIALHAPRRFPRRPDGILHSRPDMNDEEMKRVFIALAQQRRESYGHR